MTSMAMKKTFMIREEGLPGRLRRVKRPRKVRDGVGWRWGHYCAICARSVMRERDRKIISLWQEGDAPVEGHSNLRILCPKCDELVLAHGLSAVMASRFAYLSQLEQSEPEKAEKLRSVVVKRLGDDPHSKRIAGFVHDLA